MLKVYYKILVLFFKFFFTLTPQAKVDVAIKTYIFPFKNNSSTIFLSSIDNPAC